MSQHNIDIQAVDTEVGIPQESDGIMMIFCWAVAVANTFNLNQAYLLTSMSDLAALGINAAYDSTNATSVYQQVNDYYTEAPIGTLLWLVGVPMNTAYATYVANSTHDNLIMYTAQADPANRAKIVGYCYAPPTALQTATDFPADVIALITAAFTKQQSMFQLGYMYSVIIDGYGMNSGTLPQNLGTLTTYTSYAVSVCVTGTQPNGVSAVGLALGRFSKITIGHGFGEVDDGAIAATQAFLTNGITVQPGTALVVGHVYTVLGPAGATVTNNAVVYQVGQQFTCIAGQTAFTGSGGGYVADNFTPVGNVPGISNSEINGLTPAAINQLGQKNYLFIRTWQGEAGFYWNDGSTAINSDMAFSSQEYNRVVNSLSADALSFFTGKMGKNLPLDKTSGNVAPGLLNNYITQFYEDYIEPLNDTEGTGDLSDGAIVVTGANFLAAKQLKFSLTVVPTPILGSVAGTVQFAASL